MGLLTDLINHHHQEAENQRQRDYDFNSKVVLNQDKDENGNPIFTHTDRDAAMGRIFQDPHLKQHKGMLPFFKSLLLGGGGNSQPQSQAASPARSQVRDMSPQAQPAAAQPMPATRSIQTLIDGPSGSGGSAPAPTPTPSSGKSTPDRLWGDPMEDYDSPSQSISPRLIAGLPPNPNSDGGQATQPSAQAPQQAPTQTQAPAPTPIRDMRPPIVTRNGQTVPHMMTDAESMDRARQHSDFTGELALRQQPVQAELLRREKLAQFELYHQMIAQGATPYQALAAFSGEKPLPSGYYTGQARAVPGSAYVQGTDNQGQAGYGFTTPGQGFQVIPGITGPGPQHTQTQSEAMLLDHDTVNTYLGRYNAAHPDQKPLTFDTAPPALRVAARKEAMDARAKDTAAVKNYEDAIRAQHPDMADADVKALAGKLFLDKDKANVTRINVTTDAARNALSEKQQQRQDAEDVAEGIMNGTVSPGQLAYLRRNGQAAHAIAYATSNGYDMLGAEKDWQAVQAHIRTMNGARVQQQVSAITALQNGLPMLKDAYANWKATNLPTGFKDYNRKALEYSARLPGPSGVAAQELMRQINDAAAEIGSIYMQGNSNTDHSLELAKTNLSADWNSSMMETAMGNIEKYAAIRLNSIRNSPVVQATPNRYDNNANAQNQNQPAPPTKQAWQTPPRPGAIIDTATMAKYAKMTGGNPAETRKAILSDNWRIPN